MVVKLLFGGVGGGGSSRKRESAAAKKTGSSRTASKPFNSGDQATKSTRRIQQEPGPRKVLKQQVPKTPNVVTPRITVVSTRVDGGGQEQEGQQKRSLTPPTVATTTFRGGDYCFDETDDYDEKEQPVDDGNDVSATSSMMLRQLQVRHENVDDSFEVLTAESQRALQQEQAIRKQLFGAPRHDDRHKQGALLAVPEPVMDEESAPPDLSKSAVDTSSSTASSGSRLYTPKQNVQFVRFSSYEAPVDAARLVEAAMTKDDDNMQRSASQRQHPTASRFPTRRNVPPSSNPPVRTNSNEQTPQTPMQTAPSTASSRGMATTDAAVITPGSIPLTLPQGARTTTNKPPRPPNAPSSSSSSAAANVMCAISAPAKPFRSHMGSFDTLDTSMSPITILKHDPNISLDTTQTTNNLRLGADGNGFDGTMGEDPRAAPPSSSSSFATPSTSPWMDQWNEFTSKVSLAVASCQPKASQMAKKSESLVMDLFYDATSPVLNCLGKDSNAESKRPLYNEEVTLEFIHLMMTTGVTVLHMQPPNTPPLNPTLDWKGRSVVMILEPGGGGNGTGNESCVPRLEWTTVAGGTHFEISTAGLHLLEILSVRSRDDEDEEEFVDDEELDDDFGDSETNPSTDDDRPFTSRRGKYLSRRHPALSADHGSLASTTVEDEPPGLDFSCYFTITSTSGDVHVFEAASVQDKNKIIQGLRNVIAWLSYSTVMGDTTASSILFSEETQHQNGPDGNEPAELPMLAKQPHRIAMNRTAHVLLDE